MHISDMLGQYNRNISSGTEELKAASGMSTRYSCGASVRETSSDKNVRFHLIYPLILLHRDSDSYRTLFCLKLCGNFNK